MAGLNGLAASVVGSGVFGLTAALQLARQGVFVTLYDPAPLGDNASGVAAGMLAPALETGLDATADHFPLLLRARDRWPDLLSNLGVGTEALGREGAVFVAGATEVAALERRLEAAGAQAELLSRSQALAMAPGLALSEAEQALLAPQDWRLSPPRLLRALRAAYDLAGGQVRSDRVGVAGGRLVTEAGVPLASDVVVLASGAQASELVGAAPELALLQPVKGQILHFKGGPSAGPVIRTPRGYLAPQPEGAVVGATMEPGLSDRTTDPATLATLRAEASRLFPALAAAPAQGMAGVRAATPDGLPLVGSSVAGPDVVLCVGARRNGWLLAPLAAEIVVATLSGTPGGSDAEPLSPARFGAA